MGQNTPKKPSKTKTSCDPRKAPSAAVQSSIDKLSPFFFASLDQSVQLDGKPADLMRKFFNALKNITKEVEEVDANSLVCTAGLGKALYAAVVNHQTNLKRKIAQDNRKEVSVIATESDFQYASEEASVDKNQPDAESAERAESDNDAESE